MRREKGRKATPLAFPRLLDDVDGLQVGAALEAHDGVHRQLSEWSLSCVRILLLSVVRSDVEQVLFGRPSKKVLFRLQALSKLHHDANPNWSIKLLSLAWFGKTLWGHIGPVYSTLRAERFWRFPAR